MEIELGVRLMGCLTETASISSMSGFRTSGLKVKRANKHVGDLHEMLVAFSNTDFYSMRVEEDAEGDGHFLCLDMDMSALDMEEAALIIGDALHNLRSALDHLWYQAVSSCGGKPGRFTYFPIHDTREALENKLSCALKDKKITKVIRDFTLDQVKPYQAGNPALWGLNRLSVADKHEIFIPMLEFVVFVGVRLEDEKNFSVGLSEYLAEKSCSLKLTGTYRRKVTLKDKGRGSPAIIFNREAPAFSGETIIPTLKRVSEEVTRVIDVFKLQNFV